jgi:hypothetical protein
MVAVARNMPCPCGSGRKYKQCCLRGAANPRLGAPHCTPLSTIDATGHGCRWTIYAAAAPEEAGAPGEFVEHHCTGERFMASKGLGWLQDGKRLSIFQVLDGLPPELCDWVVRESLEAVSDEDLTPLGIEVVGLIALASSVLELVGDPRALKPRRRVRLRPRRAAA